MQNTQLSTVDDILNQQENIGQIKMMKIDTEGAELDVIQLVQETSRTFLC